MIRLLAQIISRQLRTNTQRIGEEATLSPLPDLSTLPTFSSSRPTPSVKELKPAGQTLTATRYPQPATQDLVVLFSELAQRHLQAAQAQTGGDR